MFNCHILQKATWSSYSLDGQHDGTTQSDALVLSEDVCGLLSVEAADARVLMFQTQSELN